MNSFWDVKVSWWRSWTQLILHFHFIWSRAGDPFWGRVPKLSLIFEEIVSRAHTNVEEQNEVSESSIIIINYCIIIINNACYKYINNAQ